MSSLGSRTQDPADRVNYAVDWSDWLAANNNDVILSATWLGSGATIVDQSETTDTATVQIADVAEGRSYRIANTILTAGGQTKRVSFELSGQLQ